MLKNTALWERYHAIPIRIRGCPSPVAVERQLFSKGSHQSKPDVRMSKELSRSPVYPATGPADYFERAPPKSRWRKLRITAQMADRPSRTPPIAGAC